MHTPEDIDEMAGRVVAHLKAQDMEAGDLDAMTIAVGAMSTLVKCQIRQTNALEGIRVSLARMAAQAGEPAAGFGHIL